MRKIIACSDTHGKHWDVKIPKGDIFIFAGDWDITDSQQLFEFNQWIARIPAKYKIAIGGNHDSYLEFIEKEECRKQLTNCIYLENESVEIEDLKIWGSPFSCLFNSWSFMRYDSDLKEIWQTIPSDTDIVVTHTMPYGILDRCGLKMESVGSLSLRDRIKEIQPKIHIGGHLHESYGKYTDYKTNYYNVALMDDMYNLTNQPTIIEV